MDLTQVQISEIISKEAQSESVFCSLMGIIINSLTYHERADYVSAHSSEQCNGFRPRRWYAGGYILQLRIPRTHSGSFYPFILSVISSENEERASLFHELYTRGMTTEDIGTVCERLYGHHYSKQQVSHLSTRCREDVEAWLSRDLSAHYPVVYIDATYVPTRREGSVSREAYYTVLGVCDDGSREVLALVNHPTEGALCWEAELKSLKDRGVRGIDLVVSDALSGIENAVCSAFPSARHQFCVAHFKRNALAAVSSKDKPQMSRELEELFEMEDFSCTSAQGYEKLTIFAERWGSRYPSLKRLGHERNAAYFTYLSYPPQYRRMIYTTNWIERLNRSYKRVLRMRASMPSPQATLFLLGSVAFEKTNTTYARRLALFANWNVEIKKWNKKEED